MILATVAIVVCRQQLQPAAEFAAQRAVWMSWPTYDHKKGVSVAVESLELIRNLVRDVDVELLVTNEKVGARVKRQVRSPRLHTHVVDYAEIWMRDFGPSFLTFGKQRAIADFGFNYWGYESPTSAVSKTHEKIDRTVAGWRKVPTVPSGTVGEGGNREANGEGVLMVVGAVELQRNPGMTREQIEDRLRMTLGVDTILWLPQGVVEDGYSFDGPIDGDKYLPITTGGHCDNVARFVSADTIALAEVTEAEATQSPVARENRRRLEAAREVIAAGRTSKGKPFKIVRMPAPNLAYETMRPGDPVYDFLAALTYPGGHKFPKGKAVKVVYASSYMNFLITNDLVLTSKFYRPGLPIALKEKDRRAAAILQNLFPTRKIKPLQTRAINLGGGGIHCITMHEPK